MKQLKDYLHLYPKAHLLAWDDDGRAFDVGSWYIDGKGNLVVDHYIMDFEDVKISLRHLSDMTEEELKDWLELETKIRTTEQWMINEANRTSYLLSKHFDVFGLIQAGLAIDKTKVK